jgi:FtsH-binding integral membrane protein
MASSSAAAPPGAAPRPPAYPVSYRTLHEDSGGDVEKGSGVEADMLTALDVARQGFIKKTLGILSAQLLVTAVVSLAIAAWPPLTRFAAGPTSPLPAICALTTLGLVLYLSFSERARHEHPRNLIVLGLFTLAEAVLVGAIAAQYTIPSLLLAFAATGLASGAVATWAATAKRDLTASAGALLGALVALLGVSLLALFVPSVRAFDAVIAGFGAALFAAWLAVDVQMIYGGSGGGSSSSNGGGSGSGFRQHVYGPDEHVAAALAVYLDVINMLVYLLRLFGERRE